MSRTGHIYDMVLSSGKTLLLPPGNPALDWAFNTRLESVSVYADVHRTANISVSGPINLRFGGGDPHPLLWPRAVRWTTCTTWFYQNGRTLLGWPKDAGFRTLTSTRCAGYSNPRLGFQGVLEHASAHRKASPAHARRTFGSVANRAHLRHGPLELADLTSAIRYSISGLGLSVQFPRAFSYTQTFMHGEHH